MAFLKRASAVVVHPRITSRGWGGIRKVASAGSPRNLSDQAREILGGSVDPDKFLFTHCTIVASVDTDKVPDVKTGKVKIGSTTVDRRYLDYHIKPDCSQFVNNNGDSWSRQVLLASYPTFIGAHNFLEHVQIEEKSKGRILDAVARDVGDSIYIDILVATDRKHSQLIQDIESGAMGTLSMGCTTDFTICSKCGHFAVDETEVCEHIRYQKLNTFIDDQGNKRVIAELCGHVDYKDNAEAPAGVRFIEASWVAVPAFPGAVMRNILSPAETGKSASELRSLLGGATPNWSDSAIQKAANLSAPSFNYTRKNAFDFGEDEGGGGEEGGDEKKEAPDPLKELEDSGFTIVMDRIRGRLEKELTKKPPEEVKKEEDLNAKPSVAPNDTVIKEARVRYDAALQEAVRVAKSPEGLVDGIHLVNQSFGIRVSPRVYKAALYAGPRARYANSESYVSRVNRLAGRALSLAELRVVVRVGTLLAQWASSNNPNRHQ